MQERSGIRGIKLAESEFTVYEMLNDIPNGFQDASRRQGSESPGA
ncbi:hypothetical protein [Photorhabdus luminescens]|nr:hypothetical protein [Photorhabdus luminescens]